MTLESLLEEGIRQLRSAGVPDAGLDARWLLLEAFHMDEVHFLMDRTKQLDISKLSDIPVYRQMIRRRAEREPLQYILGRQEFMGLDFAVNRHVLIPRQDTETLVELVLREQKDRDRSLLDLCTGSGCIAISLAVRGGYRSVTAADLSRDALKVAAENAERLLPSHTAWRLCGGDLFEALPHGEKYDILVSNPPYIPDKDIVELQPEVSVYEPDMALNGGADGLNFYRRIAAEAGGWMKSGGVIYLEIGWDQGEAVSLLLREHGFRDIQVFQDLSGLDRVVRGGYYV